MEEDWHTSAFTSRRLPHGKSQKSSSNSSSRASKNTHKSHFDPKSSYGVYEIGCPALAKLILKASPGLVTDAQAERLEAAGGLGSPISEVFSPAAMDGGAGFERVGQGSGVGSGQGEKGGKKGKKGKGNSRRGSKDDRLASGRDVTDAKFEIHGLVEGEGNEGALMCSFDFGGVIHGVAVLAGSRKLLTKVVAELEGDDEAEQDLEAESVASTTGYGSDDEEEVEVVNEIEEADERERRKIAAFEKNSFRVPKFWMRWRGFIAADAIATTSGETGDVLQRSKSGLTVEVDTGYLVFSGNDCARFSGTISCQALGWKNVKISGSKVVSKARDCPIEWSDVVIGEETSGKGSRRRR